MEFSNYSPKVLNMLVNRYEKHKEEQRKWYAANRDIVLAKNRTTKTCEVCNKSFSFHQNYYRHCRSRRHKLKSDLNNKLNQ